MASVDHRVRRGSGGHDHDRRYHDDSSLRLQEIRQAIRLLGVLAHPIARTDHEYCNEEQNPGNDPRGFAELSVMFKNFRFTNLLLETLTTSGSENRSEESEARRTDQPPSEAIEPSWSNGHQDSHRGGDRHHDDGEMHQKRVRGQAKKIVEFHDDHRNEATVISVFAQPYSSLVAIDFSPFERAGLLGTPDTARRELVEWLHERGLSFEQITSTMRDPSFEGLLDEWIRLGQLQVSIRQIADRLSVPIEEIRQVRVASGLNPIGDDEPAYMADDIRAFETLRVGAQLFTWSELVGFVRVVGSSMARTADAANSLFLEDLERPMVESGASGIELFRNLLNAQGLANELTSVLTMLLRLHLNQSIQRTRQSFGGSIHEHSMGQLAVGFVDLVGFTSRSTRMDAEQLSELVAKFEALASDTVTSHGGRLVKLIGDELMFVAVTPEESCVIGDALLREFSTDPALTPRGGIAYGPVLSRSGDYFGSTVNLAARLVDQAVPGEILVTSNIAESSSRRLEPAGRRMLKGFPDPVTVCSLSI